MSPNEYQDSCKRTLMPDKEQTEKIIFSLRKNERYSQVIIAGLKLCSEAGELNDSIVKHLSYGQPMDEENIIEECSDLLWYIATILTSLEVNMEQCMEDNINKLKIRYPEKFTEEHAAKRLDKVDYTMGKFRCPACGSLEHTICEGL